MDLLDKKTNEELSQSIVAELAKAQNEISCARRDLDKAQSRISFALALENLLMKRHKDKQQ
jgi:hypothetical protein